MFYILAMIEESQTSGSVQFILENFCVGVAGTPETLDGKCLYS